MYIYLCRTATHQRVFNFDPLLQPSRLFIAYCVDRCWQICEMASPTNTMTPEQMLLMQDDFQKQVLASMNDFVTRIMPEQMNQFVKIMEKSVHSYPHPDPYLIAFKKKESQVSQVVGWAEQEAEVKAKINSFMDSTGRGNVIKMAQRQ